MKRVLVVEDHEDNLELIVVALEDRYEVLAARDGEEALQVARARAPDLILMDLSLPGMDGWRAVAALKADQDLSAIPVVAVTAHALAGDREKALAAGCDDYLSKPIALPALYGVVGRFLGDAPDPR